MDHHEKLGFKSYVLVDASGSVSVLDKRDIGTSTQDRIFRSSSVIAVFDDGGVEVIKSRNSIRFPIENSHSGDGVQDSQTCESVGKRLLDLVLKHDVRKHFVAATNGKAHVLLLGPYERHEHASERTQIARDIAANKGLDLSGWELIVADFSGRFVGKGLFEP